MGGMYFFDIFDQSQAAFLARISQKDSRSNSIIGRIKHYLTPMYFSKYIKQVKSIDGGINDLLLKAALFVVALFSEKGV